MPHHHRPTLGALLTGREGVYPGTYDGIPWRSPAERSAERRNARLLTPTEGAALEATQRAAVPLIRARRAERARQQREDTLKVTVLMLAVVGLLLYAALAHADDKSPATGQSVPMWLPPGDTPAWGQPSYPRQGWDPWAERYDPPELHEDPEFLLFFSSPVGTGLRVVPDVHRLDPVRIRRDQELLNRLIDRLQRGG